jgi:hypothetical protein
VALAMIGRPPFAQGVSDIKLPPRAQVVPDSVVTEDYGEAEIQLTEDGPPS